jgi:hypothetical protein
VSHFCGLMSDPSALESYNEPEQRATCLGGSERDDGIEDELQAAGSMGDTAWIIGDDEYQVHKATVVKSMFQGGYRSSDCIRQVLGMIRYTQRA